MFVRYDKMDEKQQSEVRSIYPKWEGDHFNRYLFWVKPNGRISMRLGHFEWTPEYTREVNWKLRGQPRSKGDLREWKPGITFHFDRYPKDMK